MTRKSIIINYKHIRKPYLTLEQRYRNKRKLKKLINRWKPIAIILLLAFIAYIVHTGTITILSKLEAKEIYSTIDSNIIYTIAPLETKITPKKDIIVPKVINYTPQKKTIAREAKKEVVKKSLQPQSDVQKQVQAIAGEYGWGTGEQWEALSWIIQKESSWNPNAQNPKSTAYGLFQHLDMTRKNYNCPKTADVEIQTRCGIKYIQARYKTPTGARQFWTQNKWY